MWFNKCLSLTSTKIKPRARECENRKYTWKSPEEKDLKNFETATEKFNFLLKMLLYSTPNQVTGRFRSAFDSQ